MEGFDLLDFLKIWKNNCCQEMKNRGQNPKKNCPSKNECHRAWLEMRIIVKKAKNDK
jgi:hypothetical protein